MSSRTTTADHRRAARRFERVGTFLNVQKWFDGSMKVLTKHASDMLARQFLPGWDLDGAGPPAPERHHLQRPEAREHHAQQQRYTHLKCLSQKHKFIWHYGHRQKWPYADKNVELVANVLRVGMRLLLAGYFTLNRTVIYKTCCMEEV